MNFEFVLFLGSATISRDDADYLCDRGYGCNLDFVRYADDHMQSPSCCDWIVPGLAY